MAVYREIPKCAFCDAAIAEAVYQDQSNIPDMLKIIGDTFLYWNYIPHECEQIKKFSEKLDKQSKGLMDKPKTIDFTDIMTEYIRSEMSKEEFNDLINTRIEEHRKREKLYTESEVDFMLDVHRKAHAPLEQLEDLWRKENPRDEFVIPDRTDFCKWIVRRMKEIVK